MTLSYQADNSLFLPRELFAPLPVSASGSNDDPFHAPFETPFDMQRALRRVDLYLPLQAPRKVVACT
jgi:hypothetical protein